MKIYIEEVQGCLWCPNHVKGGYPGDRDKQGRCKAVFTKGKNHKLIWEKEMYDKSIDSNPYFKFPEWCPLEDKVGGIE